MWWSTLPQHLAEPVGIEETKYNISDTAIELLWICHYTAHYEQGHLATTKPAMPITHNKTCLLELSCQAREMKSSTLLIQFCARISILQGQRLLEKVMATHCVTALVLKWTHSKNGLLKYKYVCHVFHVHITAWFKETHVSQCTAHSPLCDPLAEKHRASGELVLLLNS